MSNEVQITEATMDDVLELALILREPDREEIEAATGQDPALVLEMSLNSSIMVWAGRIDGELLCIFGVGVLTVLSGIGVPWLLGSKSIDKYSKTFMRQTVPYMNKMKRLCPILINYVDARNRKSIVWLKRLGFTILEPEPWGVSQLPFHRFEMRT